MIQIFLFLEVAVLLRLRLPGFLKIRVNPCQAIPMRTGDFLALLLSDLKYGLAAALLLFIGLACKPFVISVLVHQARSLQFSYLGSGADSGGA